MNDNIIKELEVFFYSWVMGVGAAVLYDGIRIIRRIISHGVIFIAIEDLIFWVFSSYALFIMLMQEYSGKIRWFTIVGVMIGVILYRLTISDFLVRIISMMINKPLQFLLGKGEKVMKYVKNQLTKRIKLAKIKLCKHRGER